MNGQLLPVCAITRSQLAALLVTYEQPVRFPFVMEAHIPADIHDYSLDRAGEWPGILAWIVRADRLATVAPNVQPLASNREPARLGPDLAFTNLLVVDVDGQGPVGNVRWVLSLFGEDGRESRGPGWYWLAGTDLLLQ